MSAPTGTHPVLAALERRPEGARLALVIEGGGMRGAVSGGMVLALEELGFRDAFDAVYGSSAGTLNGMWLISGRVREGLPTWVDPNFVSKLIDRRKLLRGQPVVDIRKAIEHRYEQLAPGLFADVLRAPTELHPLATDITTGEAVDLYPEIRDERTLQLALRASASLPLLAGPPVELGGRRWLDAGLSAAIPLDAALADGATHVLVLRSRRQGHVAEPPGRLSGALMGRLLSRVDPAVARAYATRAINEGRVETLLDEHAADPARRPHVLSIRPPQDAPVPSRLERDLDVVRAALEAGRGAAAAALFEASARRAAEPERSG